MTREPGETLFALLGIAEVVASTVLCLAIVRQYHVREQRIPRRRRNGILPPPTLAIVAGIIIAGSDAVQLLVDRDRHDFGMLVITHVVIAWPLALIGLYRWLRMLHAVTPAANHVPLPSMRDT